MLTWQRWSHCWVHNKLFNLNWVTATSPDKAGILMWRYSPIYVLTDQQLSFKALFSIQAIRFCFGGTPDYLPSRVSWWADLRLSPLCLSSFIRLLFSLLYASFTSLWGFFRIVRSPQKSWDISASLLLSFPHRAQTWRPITALDNARHKSSIGLWDTEGHG